MKTLQESLAFSRRIASGEIAPDAAVQILVQNGTPEYIARRRVSVLIGQRDGEMHPNPKSLPDGEGL